MKKKAAANVTWEQRIISGVFATFAILLLAFFVYLVATNSEGQFVTLLATVIALVGSRASDIISLNLSAQGLSAELKQQIDEAQATLTELQNFAKSWATLTTEIIYGSGRFGGMSKKTRAAMDAEVRKTLTAMGVEPDSVIDSVANKYHHFDYYHAVFKAGPVEYDPAWNDARDAHSTAHQGIGNEAGPDEVEALFKAHNRLTPEVTEALADYRHFERTGKHRRAKP